MKQNWDPRVADYFKKAACRYFRDPHDREEAIQEAWASLTGLPDGMSHETYCLCGYRAIHACYQRKYRARRKKMQKN